MEIRVWAKLLLPLALLSSCQRDKFEEARPTISVSVSASLNDTRISFSKDRSTYVWGAEDSITVFNNIDNSSSSFGVNTLPYQLDVPGNASVLYGISPASKTSDGPSSVGITIPVSQLQNAAGVLEGGNYPFAASSEIKESAASLVFFPLVCVLAINAYNEAAAAGEMLEKITLSPLNNTGVAGAGTVDLTTKKPSFSAGDSGDSPVSVQLSTPVALSNAAPSTTAEKRGFASQMYILVTRQAYTSLRFEVKTNKNVYRLDSSPSFVFDAQGNDVLVVGLDLARGKVMVDGTASLDKPLQYPSEEQTTDRIPDFSRVGYHYGDKAIPSVKEAKMIGPKMVEANLKVNGGAYDDTTAYIQAMIDSVGKAGGGAVRLTKGTFKVSRILFIDYDNVVLRGTDRTGTVILSSGSLQRPVICMGKTFAWTSSYPDSTNVAGRRVAYSKLKAAGSGGASSFGSVYIIVQTAAYQSQTYSSPVAVSEDYVPVGRDYIEVKDAGSFSVGDRIAIYRPNSSAWISDIGMDKIASNGRDDPSKTSYSPTVQWSDRNFEMYWERRVVAISGKRLYLDAPVVQSLDAAYGGGVIYKSSCPRVKECGVENLTIKSTYNSSLKKGSDYIDEAHSWIAVDVHDAEHCWIRDVDCHYMGYALVRAKKNARCISVLNCNYYSPVSIVTGARRYAYCLEPGASLCLISNCTMESDRHGCVTNGLVCGPNVYTNCTGTKMRAEMGPHQSWANGTLYDCVKSSAGFATQDRGNYGTGHGWTSATDVFWNIEAGGSVICQSSWSKENTPSLTFASTHSSGRNYAVGVIGTKSAGRNVNTDYFSKYVTDYYKNTLGFENRPDGEWYPSCSAGASGSVHISLPDSVAAATCDWWPVFTLNSFSDPLSLYQSQLEDRHSRGVYFTNL